MSIKDMPCVTVEQVSKLRDAAINLEKKIVGMEWQPIETAPKDGAEVLLFRPLAYKTNDPVIAIRRTINTNHGCWEETIPKGMDCSNYTDGYCKATHWMPLPEAPK